MIALQEVSEENLGWLRDGIRVAAADHRADTGTEPTPLDIVGRMLSGAMEVLRHVKNQERAWIYSLRSLWPSVTSDRGQEIANLKDLLERIKRGEESVDVLFAGGAPTPQQVARMDAVLEELPKMLAGRNRQRDWQILTYTARGLGLETVARIVRCSRTTVSDKRKLQLTVVGQRLAEAFPDEMPRNARDAA